jgi:methylmalonyl-CoA/ethylmalonyl-CoA epimerase
MTESIQLDHVALAFHRAFDGFNRYRGDLGGSFIGGGVDPGFYWGQVRYDNGMRVELLESADPAIDDFLERFLRRSGPGPHHFTFKVPDIRDVLERVRQAGFEPARVNFANEAWQEVFLHPKQAHGIVIQMAQASGDGGFSTEDRLPSARNRGAAALDRVVHLTADLDGARRLFSGILAGTETAAGDDNGRWAELEWPGGGVIRLHQPSGGAEAVWLGDRVGRLHRLEFSLYDPASVAGVRASDDGTFELGPEDNYGTRLRLTKTAR